MTGFARRVELLSYLVALTLVTGVGALVLGTGSALAQGNLPAPRMEPADSSMAAAPRTPAPLVASIRFAGRARIDSVRIARAFEVRVGRPYDAREVRAGLLRLWETSLFDDLEVRGSTDEAGVHLVLAVAERPRVARISFEGNQKRSEEDLLPHLGFRPGDSWRPRLLVAARDSILSEYRKEGYRATAVTATADSTGAGVWVRFAIVDGKKAQVTAVAFEGIGAFGEDALAKRLKSKKKGFPFRSGTVKEENIIEDETRIRTFYRENGFRDVTVERAPFVDDPKGGGVVLTHKIVEGPRYRTGEVHWAGNEIIKSPALASLPQPQSGEYYNGTKIRQAVEGAYAAYAEEGFLYLQVEATEFVRDSNVVDVTFQIAEGPPSKVRQVRITGNTYTKENVIRRELELHEGDLFRRSQLVNTQQSVFRLGFFEDVGVDFQPAESTDVDVVLKIKEKQTGTASAGAGYSSDGGLSGFVNLGHNNLFGNGQAVNIQLERGSSRRAVDLSFTDPWFRNTPTQVGGTAYYSERDVNSGASTAYFERRRGFSLQSGRPIPHLRYTRGLIRYRLEATTITIDNPATATPSLRALQTEGEQLTSGIELSATRNSTNHPFYPNRGQKGSLSYEFVGSFLGGDYDFSKVRFDSRWYSQSFLKGWANMVRVRGGMLGSVIRSGTVPLYERFRLGGVTFDGLRGYEDYSIVPLENINYPRFNPGTEVTLLNFALVPTPYPGGRAFTILTLEQQFPIVNPVRALIFAEGGNTWNRVADVRIGDWYKSAGVGLRVEIPILGNVGFDYAYGFDRIAPGWKGHFLFGNFFF